MEVEPRGCVIQLDLRANPQGEEPDGESKVVRHTEVCVVWDAYLHVRSRKGAPGVDEESIEKFEEELKDNLYKLWNRMSSGSYFPAAVRMVEIPKKAGGIRQLGIPTVADRIAQTVVKMILEPILDPHFHEDSYGYRPNRSAIDAVGVTTREEPAGQALRELSSSSQLNLSQVLSGYGSELAAPSSQRQESDRSLSDVWPDPSGLVELLSALLQVSDVPDLANVRSGADAVGDA